MEIFVGTVLKVWMPTPYARAPMDAHNQNKTFINALNQAYLQTHIFIWILQAALFFLNL